VAAAHGDTAEARQQARRARARATGGHARPSRPHRRGGAAARLAAVDAAFKRQPWPTTRRGGPCATQCAHRRSSCTASRWRAASSPDSSAVAPRASSCGCPGCARRLCSGGTSAHDASRALGALPGHARPGRCGS
jgi:hypothetical protein